MGYTLSTEELRKEFGNIYLEIISHTGHMRTSCIRRSSDDAVLAYSIVVFHNEGVAAFDKTFHERIISGKALGETIKNSGVPHERSVSEPFSSTINFGLGFLFDTKKRISVSREIEYKIRNLPYASITEFYNPEFTPVGETIIESSEDAATNSDDWFLIGQLKAGFEEEYLKLAHGFLKKPMHVGIEDRDSFVKETRHTLDLLIRDSNTNLFVAANKEQFIGYVALNIHPALHVNGLECVVRELYVREDRHGKGIGTMLMEYVERFAKKRECKRMSLATKWDDEEQMNFYEAIGFSRRCDFAIKNI